MTRTKIDPTAAQSTAYRAAYDYFNAKLFGGKLAPVFLNFSRMSKAKGFFAPERWGHNGKKLHEISLNPLYMSSRSLKESMSTLVHEMAHAWQAEHGTVGRGGYHNREWAEKMKEIGLHPTATGEIGGPETGDRVTHVIVAGGPFCKAFDAMPASAKLPLSSREFERAAAAKRKPSKLKYTCPGCACNCWAAPERNLMCGDCEEPMVCEEPDAESKDATWPHRRVA